MYVLYEFSQDVAIKVVPRNLFLGKRVMNWNVTILNPSSLCDPAVSVLQQTMPTLGFALSLILARENILSSITLGCIRQVLDRGDAMDYSPL